MAQNYRHQNESGRWQEHPRSGPRNLGGRERYETGDERRYSPDWDERFSQSSGQYDTSPGAFEGDRYYSAGGYPEEFGYRHESHADREGSARFGGHQEGREQDRFAGQYAGAGTRYGRNQDYGSRDFNQRDFNQTGPGRFGAGRFDQNRYDFNRGEDFNRNRGGLYGTDYSSQRYGQESSNYQYGAQGNFGRDNGNEQNWQSQQQSYRGRGPKGYERSDERLKEMICERLTEDHTIDASEVSVEVTNKTVKLTGTVNDRRIKYLIEDVIEQCGGVRDIDNQLRVQSQSGQSQSSQYGTAITDNGFTNRGIDNRSSTLGSTTGTPSTKRN